MIDPIQGVQTVGEVSNPYHELKVFQMKQWQETLRELMSIPSRNRSKNRVWKKRGMEIVDEFMEVKAWIEKNSK